MFHSIPLMAPMIVVMHENMVQTPPKSAHPCDPIHSTSTTVQSQEPYHTIRWSRPQEHTMHQHQVPFWPCGNTKWAPTNGSFGTSFGGLRAAGAAPYMHSCIPPHNRDSMGATGPCSCAWAHAEACACISCSSTAGSGGDGILMPFDRFFATPGLKVRKSLSEGGSAKVWRRSRPHCTPQIGA